MPQILKIILQLFVVVFTLVALSSVDNSAGAKLRSREQFGFDSWLAEIERFSRNSNSNVDAELQGVELVILNEDGTKIEVASNQFKDKSKLIRLLRLLSEGQVFNRDRAGDGVTIQLAVGRKLYQTRITRAAFTNTPQLVLMAKLAELFSESAGEDLSINTGKDK